MYAAAVHYPKKKKRGPWPVSFLTQCLGVCADPFNDSLKGDANTNIEGIRRTLAMLYKEKAMPRALYVQADNASDNKNWTVMLWFGMLIHHGYIEEVFFSFLMVGHTV